MTTVPPYATFRHRIFLLLGFAVGLDFTISRSFAANEFSQNTHPPTSATESGAIPFSQLGARVMNDCQGEGTGITTTIDGAYLHTDFQKLGGTVTRNGLRMESTEQEGGVLRLTASSISRADSERTVLSPTGIVSVGAKTVSFVRPGLTEEYSVSVDGVRQDFIIPARPAGTGKLVLNLALTGARAETTPEGAKLFLEGSGRGLAYTRLLVVDAAGHELTANLEVLAPDHLAVRVDDASAAYPVRIDPTFSDADWVSMNPGIAGLNGVAADIAVDGDGNLYVGGNFTVAGTVPANNIAKWNGSEWSPLGAGLTGGGVSNIEMIGSDLYAAGNFTAAGGVAANQVAKWNGSEWSPMAGGVDGRIFALLADGNVLYAGGQYQGGYRCVVKWDGTSWSALGPATNGHVYALAKYNGELYAAGGFNSAGGVPVEGITKWNGTAWAATGGGVDLFGTIYSLASDGTNLYVGGSFQFSLEHPQTARNIAKWDGAAWSILGTGITGIVLTLKVSGNDLYVGGNFNTAGGIPAMNLAKWNGGEWSALGSGTSGTVEKLAVDGDKVYMGGNFHVAGGTNARFIAVRNQGSWSSLGSGMDGGVSEFFMSGTDLYVGGAFTRIGGISANNVAKWNGSAWSALGAGTDGVVRAFETKGSDLYVGGNFSEAGGLPANSIAKWDGTTWTALGNGVSGEVSALKFMGEHLYVGGSFYTNEGVSAISLAKWDGTGWSPVGTGVNGSVSALISSGTDLYVAGGFGTAGGNPAKNIAKWDGSQWSPLGAGLNSHTYALAMIGLDLYAGGMFKMAGDVPAQYIAKWNGYDWSALGSGMVGNNLPYVGTLVTSGTKLYAGGQFTNAGGVPGTRNIAEWNGSTWSAIGTGTDARVTELAVGPASQLFLGGEFTLAGSTVSPNIVRADNLLGVPRFSVGDGTSALADGSADPVDFGSIPVGEHQLKTLTITNSSDAGLTLATIQTDGMNDTDFIAGTPATVTVASGGSTTFTITFAPTGAGRKMAAIHIVGSGADDTPFDIVLTGTGVQTTPEISVSQLQGGKLVDGLAKKSFGTVKVGYASATKTFIIKNTGNAPLTGVVVSKKGDHKKDFIITPPDKTRLAPGTSIRFKVQFKPTDRRTRNASIHIQSNDADENPFDIDLTGLGAAR